MDADRWDARYAAEPAASDVEPNPYVPQIFSPLTPGRVLDIGCGPGRNARYLARHGWTVTATDFSAVALAQLRAHAAAEQLTVQTYLGDARDIPPGDYDAVLLSFLHEQPDRRRTLYRRITEHLVPDGLLVITAHSAASRGRSGPDDPDILFDPDDVLTDCADLPLRPVRAELVSRLQPDGHTALDTVVLMCRDRLSHL